MPDTYPKPTERAVNDFGQYIPLLLGAIDAELMREDAWTEADRTDALLYIDDLKTYIMMLPGLLMSSVQITEFTITPATVFPFVLKAMQTGETADEILVAVDIAFDAGLLQVGDDINPDRLMPYYFNDLAQLDQYQVSPQYKYTEPTDVKIYLTGTPTVGSARIVLYSYQ